MTDDLVFTRQGRSFRAIAAVAAIYLFLIALWAFLDAAPWLVSLLLLPTLPALWDILTNPGAGLLLTDTALEWHSGRRAGRLELAEIRTMRFDTRWDFSVRVSAMLQSGKRVRLPQESLPPHRRLEAEFRRRGVPVERHHFTVF